MVNFKEIKLAGELISEAADATAAAIHASPTATKLLEASGLHLPHMPTISAPAILGERIGSMLTNDRIKTFAEDLFGHLEKHPSADFDLEDRLSATSWNHSRRMSTAERAISKAGVHIEGLDGIADTRPLYESLKGAPAARAALTRFTNARDEFREANSAYNKTVIGPKFADTFGATNRVADQSGLVRPRIRVSNQLAEADASYSNFGLTYPTSAFDGSTVSLVQSSGHELTHLEQHQLQLFFKADELGIGAQASPEQLKALDDWFRAAGNETSPQAIRRGLEIRAGRHLNDEAAERAHATLQSSDEVAKLWLQHAPDSQRLALLNYTGQRVSFGADAANVALELAHPQSGLLLSNQLFGVENGAQMFAKYSQNAGVAEGFSSLSKKQKDVFRSSLLTDIEESTEQTRDKMEPYFQAYRSSRHEVEAYDNGKLAASFHPQNYLFKGGF